MDERAAFEKNIDDNPLDSTNHLVYADWLDEHGEPDEAAFRRAMGEWVNDKGKHIYQGGNVDPYFDEHRWYANNLPSGTEGRVTTRAFRSYRDMEGHFRRAFTENRQQQRVKPEQLSRRRTALKKYKKS